MGYTDMEIQLPDLFSCIQKGCRTVTIRMKMDEGMRPVVLHMSVGIAYFQNVENKRTSGQAGEFIPVDH